MRLGRLVMLGALLGVVACGEHDDDSAHGEDECPSELSYAKAAEPFLEAYCLTCHAQASAALAGDGYNFETEALVREHGEHVYEAVDSGEMPASGPKPPDAEKRAFLEWLQCSGAAGEHDHHQE